MARHASVPDRTTADALTELSERHEVRVRGRDQTVVFIADSRDGRLIIRQEQEGKKPKDVCAITLSNSDELRAFFQGLRRIMASLGEVAEPSAPSAPRPWQYVNEERDALMAKARQRNAQAFAPWSPNEEQEVRKRYEAGERVEAIAQAHQRSPRAIELRLQRMGLLPPDDKV
jgi:hypothetical protein